MEKEIKTSAPGKVLLTGGYLVLENNLAGCVVSTDARFHVTITNSTSTTPIASDTAIVIVKTPQFLDKPREYFLIDNIITCSSTSTNPFVDYAIRLAYLYSPFKPCHLTIEADNDFYSHFNTTSTTAISDHSQNLPVNCRSKLLELPKYHKIQALISQTPKTGLGSSAALTVSLISALLLHSGSSISRDSISNNFDTSSDIELSKARKRDLDIVHNLSQISHCMAQGKIGSGFDISSAVYGSQVYRRFSPDILQPILTSKDSLISQETLKNIVDKTWDAVVEKFEIVPELSVILADIKAGSNTPSMVSKVMQWKQDNPSLGTELWNELNIENERVRQCFHELKKLKCENRNGFNAALVTAKSYNMRDINLLEMVYEPPVLKCLKQLHESFQNIRSGFQRLTKMANVPVEPEEQTILLDACLKIPGVIAAGVPGAGGYDAIFCLIVECDEVYKDLEELWIKSGVCGLTCKISGKGVLAQ